MMMSLFQTLILMGCCVQESYFLANSMIEYHLYPDANATWNQALAFCENRDMNMVKIHHNYTSYIIQDFLHSGQYWIGLQYHGVEPGCLDTSFRWTDCTTFEYKPLGNTPDSCSTGQCVYVERTGWNVASCSREKSVICQQTQGQCNFELVTLKHSDIAQLNAEVVELGVITTEADCRTQCLHTELNFETQCWIIQFSQGLCRLFFLKDRAVHQILQRKYAGPSNTDDYGEYDVKVCHKVNNDTGSASVNMDEKSVICITDEECYFENIADSGLQEVTYAINFTVAIETDQANCQKLCLNATTGDGLGCWLIDSISSSTCRLYFLNIDLRQDFWKYHTPRATLFVKRCPHEIVTETPTTTSTTTVSVNDDINILLKDKTQTSNYRRKFISVYESRASAVSMGVCGSLSIGFLIGVIVCTDCPHICKHAKKIGAKNIRKRNICIRKTKENVMKQHFLESTL